MERGSRTGQSNQRACERVRPLLSRYLDNDLAGRAATEVAAHLHGCVSCRRVYEEARVLRAAVRHLPEPAGADAARERVFARLERAVRTESVPTPRPVQRRIGFRFPQPVWGTAFATLAAAGIVVGVVALRPQTLQNAPTVSVTASSAPGGAAGVNRPAPVVLPAPDKMAELFQLHDEDLAAAADTTGDAAAPTTESGKTDSGVPPQGALRHPVAPTPTPKAVLVTVEAPEAL